MTRIALAQLAFPESPEASVQAASQAIEAAARAGAEVVCFPEAFIPGYRLMSRSVPAASPEFLARAHAEIASVARRFRIAVVLGSERFVDERVRLTALVVDSAGSLLGYQDKVQLDPSEDGTYTPGSARHVFRSGDLCFGVVICHEGFRYPETVRWAARRGAQLVFHPHYDEATLDSYRPERFADPNNSFHEKAILCRAAENTCYVASVNCASEGAPTTSAVANPDGTLHSFQPYGVEGLLVADLDLALATRSLALRFQEVGSLSRVGAR